MNRPINRILIANRGEIAVRIIRTCRELGIESVAVYSEADRDALHVRLADQAYAVGPAPATESYLDHEKLIAIARTAAVDAVHPGYGFLAENAAFADACAAASLIFIGPPVGAIRAMGDKTTARRLMAEAGVPMAPGTPEAIEDPDEAARFANDIGFPILIKAAAGGGGKGMRLVERPEALRGALEMASREAKSAFGDGRVYLEKYLVEPRHIEFQILADHHGNVIHLFERDCSIQRRHQKVIEEAPSTVLDASLRIRMGEAAVAAARSCGYANAGTVEFLVDHSGAFYFMEMNTRIQVEHPVTEMITGLDLVAEQIRIASGHPLRYRQDSVGRSGHAIECRIYAEDPAADFLPDPGPVLRHRPPDGPGIRLDSGVEEGGEVPIHYDPMIAKLVAWGADRAQAIARMRRALDEYEIAGVRTTIPFCRFVMQHEVFTRGEATTRFIDEHFDGSMMEASTTQSERLAALAATLYVSGQKLTGAREMDLDVRTNGISHAWRSRRQFT